MEMRIAGPVALIAQALDATGIEVEATSGHTVVEVPTHASEEQANELFGRLRQSGFRGYQKQEGEKDPSPVSGLTLDPREDVVLVPPMAGGCR